MRPTAGGSSRNTRDNARNPDSCDPVPQTTVCETVRRVERALIDGG